jgi:hypothetical protein
MKLRDYLLKEHTEETVKIYLRDIRVFLDYLPEIKAEKATYQRHHELRGSPAETVSESKNNKPDVVRRESLVSLANTKRKKARSSMPISDAKRCQNSGHPVAGFIYRIRTGTVDGPKRTI